MAKNYIATQSLNGLQTFAVFTAPYAGLFLVDGQLTLPPSSAVVAVVNVAGSPVYTGTAGATGFQVEASCASGDAVTVVLSSATAVDAPLNVVKGVVAVSDAV